MFVGNAPRISNVMCICTDDSVVEFKADKIDSDIIGFGCNETEMHIKLSGNLKIIYHNQQDCKCATESIDSLEGLI